MRLEARAEVARIQRVLARMKSAHAEAVLLHDLLGHNPLIPAEHHHDVLLLLRGKLRSTALEAYVEGGANSLERVRVTLSDLPDEHWWPGQSQWSHDPHMQGTYNEFRIYGTALTNTQVRDLLAAGPDQL